MGKIYFTSDWHFGHKKEFLWQPRGFQSSEENDQTIIDNYKAIITDEDDVYVLGDLMLEDNNTGIEKIKQLPGKIHIILGNHDTFTRIQLYQELPNVVEITYATMIKYGKAFFYLSHYPTICANYDDNKSWYNNIINLYGHTHQKWNFYYNNDPTLICGNPYMYHVGVDSHNCKPVLIDDIIEEIKQYKTDINNERMKMGLI
jgi:calcineurin-like phosphoesterase family protein